MSYLMPAASILAMVATALATLMMLAFCLAGGANSTPEQIRTLKLIMGGLSLLSLVGIIGGIVLLKAGLPSWSLGASIAPTVIMLVIFIVALNK